jgi:hypothetical protein
VVVTKVAIFWNITPLVQYGLHGAIFQKAATFIEILCFCKTFIISHQTVTPLSCTL